MGNGSNYSEQREGGRIARGRGCGVGGGGGGSAFLYSKRNLGPQSFPLCFVSCYLCRKGQLQRFLHGVRKLGQPSERKDLFEKGKSISGPKDNIGVRTVAAVQRHHDSRQSVARFLGSLIAMWGRRSRFDSWLKPYGHFPHEKLTHTELRAATATHAQFLVRGAKIKKQTKQYAFPCQPFTTPHRCSA